MPTRSRAGAPRPRGRNDMPNKTVPAPPGASPNEWRANRQDSGSDDPAAAIGFPEVDRRAVERILACVREARIQQVELQFSDVTGAVKTVAIPARRLAHVLAAGEWCDGSAIEGFAREVESDMYLRPDPSTFSVIEPAGVPCARLICEVVTPSGEPYPGDARSVLRSLLDQAESAGLGYLVAPEVEFFLFPVGDGIGPLADDPSSYFERSRGRSRQVELEIVAALETLGIRIESSHHEVASGQFELDLQLLPALVAADTFTTLK